LYFESPHQKKLGAEVFHRYQVEAAVEAAIQYVVNEQGLPMSVFENKNRTFNMAI
jgi:hypothetical protein